MRKCTVPECCDKHYAKGLCKTHYTRKINGWDVFAPRRRKRGTGGYDKDGYLIINTGNNKKRPAHCLVMEAHIGRLLLPHEKVHHLNGVKSDNDIGNLELWSVSQPAGQRVADKVLWAKEILALYEPDTLA